MNIKRIIKQVLKEQQEKGTYRDIFNSEVEELISSQMDRIAKLALENPDIEEQLIEAAEDCVRLHLIRLDFIVREEKDIQKEREQVEK